jgi:hypothetical protein
MARRSHKTWSDAEDRRLIELRDQGKGPGLIAKELGRSVEAVSQRLIGIGFRKSVKLLRRKYDD